MRSIAWNGGITFHFACPAVPVSDPELVVGWVHPWVGLGWVGLGLVTNLQILYGLDCFGSSLE